MSTPLQTARKRPFGFRDKIGYMFGDFGNDFTFILQVMFFMVFYTNVVGVSAAHVGLLLLVARILDAFTDVGMGVLVDRLPVRDGGTKFKRWIKFIMVPVAVASALMYMSFVADFDSYTAKVVWMCATYFLWGSIFYTAINIPYGSMASVITADSDERAQLSVYRSTGAALAQLFIVFVLPLVVYVTNAAGVSVLDPQRMMWGGILCSIAAVICYAVCYVFSVERIQTPVKADTTEHGLGAMAKAVVTNRALGGLIAAALILLIANLFLSGMLSYLFLNYFGNGKLISYTGLVGIIPSLALIVIAPWLAKRFGKTEVSITAMLIGGAVLLTAYFIKVESVVVWLVFYAVAIFMISIFNYLVWAFITDVIDHQEVTTGQRDDATVYAVYSWARKLGQAIAGGAIGWALSLIGYSETAAKQGTGQSVAVNESIYMLANLVPGILCVVVAAALFFLYPLKKSRVEENNRILTARREEPQILVADVASDSLAQPCTSATTTLTPHPDALNN
ncbi:GPH family glycoside/pentoside/hexuronide:cation symporter [Arcanobacterium wilhelmae]|uniref:GPH family glycoside/pentoside/hexuronide:cation symporter n=1 Tax=Arcanobacterium wilhelmae TaxID=1803177 RepID=A0ABT9NC94_9ACTO|nr:glycoside-pentoside-hexuronide (GPH):cation symporter [Arcanobacterium wilhelmae]MDP9801339.1 GPH family glycoside/pentoside/hexuronide:cation symporter [Arcanobacterium wilhelmae]